MVPPYAPCWTGARYVLAVIGHEPLCPLDNSTSFASPLLLRRSARRPKTIRRKVPLRRPAAGCEDARAFEKQALGGRVSQYQVSIDIGGDFTDCVVSDGARLAVVKAPSTPPAFERGFMDALGLAARALRQRSRGLPRPAPSASCTAPRSPPTRWWRARTGAVGLICTAGHPDVLTLAEAPRKRAFDWRLDYPKPSSPATERVKSEDDRRARQRDRTALGRRRAGGGRSLQALPGGRDSGQPALVGGGARARRAGGRDRGRTLGPRCR